MKSAGAQNLVPVRIDTFPNVDNFTWMMNFAIDQGYFARNGIQAVPTAIPTAVLQLSAISSGQADVAEMSLDVALPAIEKGVALQLIGGESSNLWQLWTSSNSNLPASFPQSVQALKGHNVGVAALGSAGQYMLDMILQAAHVDPSSVHVVSYGGALANAAAAINSGKVDAAMGAEIDHYLLTGGGRKLVDFVPSPGVGFPKDLATFAGQPYIGWVGTGAWTKAHPKLVKAFQLSLAEANCFISDPANHQAFTTWVAAHKGIPATIPQQGWEGYVYNSVQQQAFFPKTVATAWANYDLKYGMLTKAIPLNQFYATGIPQNPAGVNSLAKANGFKC